MKTKLTDLTTLNAGRVFRQAYSLIHVLNGQPPAEQVGALAVAFTVLAQQMGGNPNDLLQVALSYMARNEDVPYREQVRAMRAYMENEL